MVVRSARKADLKAFLHGSVRAVTTGEMTSLACLGGSIGALEAGAHTVSRFFECDELRLPLDADAGISKPIDQQPFVLVLRVDERIRKRTEIPAHIAEDHARRMFAGLPQIDCGHLPAFGDDGLGESDLPVQFQRTSL